MQITMTPVKSSNIKAVGYDTPSKTMRVEFLNGAHFDYHDVPADAHTACLKAESVGSHFAKHIRPKFKSVKFEGKKQ